MPLNTEVPAVLVPATATVHTAHGTRFATDGPSYPHAEEREISTEGKRFFDDVPEAIIQKIAKKLSLNFLCLFLQCSTKLFRVCCHHSIWSFRLPRCFLPLASEENHYDLLRRWYTCSAVDVATPEPKGKKPDARSFHGAVRLDDEMIVFGGKSRHIYNDCWSYNLKTNVWEQLPLGTAEAPEARYEATLLLVNRKGFLYGGRTQGNEFLTDLWQFELIDGKVYWTELAPPENPPARYGHAAVAIDNEQFVMFGGTSKIFVYNDCWLFNTKRCMWIKCTQSFFSQPDNRFGHSIVHVGNNEVLLFGGTNGYKTFNDLWFLKLNPTASHANCYKLEYASTVAPPELVGHTMTLIGGRVVITGGKDPKTRSFDSRVWFLDFKNLKKLKWRTLRWANPKLLARTGHTAIMDRDSSIVIFGGSDPHDNYLDDMRRLCLVGADVTCCNHS
jgi:N-acetylneuraminic acid mutarotase